MPFSLQSSYKPAGDQPNAINGLVSGIKEGMNRQTLLGVTGSGKTFTMANVIQEVQMPTLVIAHNKTLAAQLCNEFRHFFPDNAVEYFVSYYDYYQPEAYLPSSDTYIEKEAQINEEIDRLRHACTQALLSRDDVIIVASVSAIYGLGSPKEYEHIVLHLERGQRINRREMMAQLIEMQFTRTNSDLTRASFRMRGQVFEIMPVNEEMIYRFEISDQIDRIERIDPVTRKIINTPEQGLADFWLFPAKHYVASPESRERAMLTIRKEYEERLAYFEKKEEHLAYERLKRKVAYDLEMIAEIGYCNGIENYSRHFDGRAPGEAPFTLVDYFSYAKGNAQEKRGFLTIIDESHVTTPQIRAMYKSDEARKNNLVAHGFRLPSARDNRPLRFEEFDSRVDKVVFVSATPADYELEVSKRVVEQIVRPTGLVDPEVHIVPVSEDKKNNYPGQVFHVIEEIQKRLERKERTLVTTLTKRMAEDLTTHLKEQDISVAYLHSDVKTIERVDIIMRLRKGEIDVIVGVNLLREGLDIPEVSLVAILDADKEGFLRSETSLIQTIGRAARNVDGKVILYADHMTGSIEKAVAETNRRRELQLTHNKKHGITPATIQKDIQNLWEEFGIDVEALKEKQKKKGKGKGKKTVKQKIADHAKAALDLELAADDRSLTQIIKEKEKQMKEAAKNLEFELAALLRDEVRELKKREKGA